METSRNLGQPLPLLLLLQGYCILLLLAWLGPCLAVGPFATLAT